MNDSDQTEQLRNVDRHHPLSGCVLACLVYATRVTRYGEVENVLTPETGLLADHAGWMEGVASSRAAELHRHSS